MDIKLKNLEKGRKAKKPVLWNGQFFESIHRLELETNSLRGSAYTRLRLGQRFKGDYIELI